MSEYFQVAFSGALGIERVCLHEYKIVYLTPGWLQEQNKNSIFFSFLSIEYDRWE